MGVLENMLLLRMGGLLASNYASCGRNTHASRAARSASGGVSATTWGRPGRDISLPRHQGRLDGPQGWPMCVSLLKNCTVRQECVQNQWWEAHFCVTMDPVERLALFGASGLLPIRITFLPSWMQHGRIELHTYLARWCRGHFLKVHFVHF